MRKGEKIAIIIFSVILCLFAIIIIPIQTTALFDRLILKGVHVNNEDMSFYPRHTLQKIWIKNSIPSFRVKC
jgi:hypothetical protein